jgi:hypothetical protein
MQYRNLIPIGWQAQGPGARATHESSLMIESSHHGIDGRVALLLAHDLFVIGPVELRR